MTGGTIFPSITGYTRRGNDGSSTKQKILKYTYWLHRIYHCKGCRWKLVTGSLPVRITRDVDRKMEAEDAEMMNLIFVNN